MSKIRSKLTEKVDTKTVDAEKVDTKIVDAEKVDTKIVDAEKVDAGKNKKFIYLPKNKECIIIQDSHKKFLTIKFIEGSQELMVRREQVVSK